MLAKTLESAELKPGVEEIIDTKSGIIAVYYPNNIFKAYIPVELKPEESLVLSTFGSLFRISFNENYYSSGLYVEHSYNFRNSKPVESPVAVIWFKGVSRDRIEDALKSKLDEYHDKEGLMAFEGDFYISMVRVLYKLPYWQEFEIRVKDGTITPRYRIFYELSMENLSDLKEIAARASEKLMNRISNAVEDIMSKTYKIDELMERMKKELGFYEL